MEYNYSRIALSDTLRPHRDEVVSYDRLPDGAGRFVFDTGDDYTVRDPARAAEALAWWKMPRPEPSKGPEPRPKQSAPPAPRGEFGTGFRSSFKPY